MAAALLVAGRAVSAVYADYTWYRAMAASPVWGERITDMVLLYGAGFALSFAVALANLSALTRSIGALTLPRRLANVEFGEALPRRYLDRFALVISLGVAAALLPLLPHWTSLALARLDVTFRESDPYFHHDLAFYTTWLPFERSLYVWAMLLIVTVSLIVVALYSLTPGLRWERSGLRMSARVRQHLSALAAVILLLTMWSYRLASYDLLIQTAGESAAFSFVEHQWLLPGLLILSIATAAVAATVLISGWTGQLRTSLVAVTGIIILSVAVQEVAPLIVRRFTASEALAVSERPYTATRAEFTRRAYDLGAAIGSGTGRGESGGGDTTEMGEQLLSSPGPDSLVYADAKGLVIIADPQLDVAAPRLGDGLSRLGYAWAYQSLGLLSDSVPRRARIVTMRDVRSRVERLAPVFAQGSTTQQLYHADTLYWKLELYSASSDYPLSEPRVLAGAHRSYFRHAATALVNARTARVIIAASPSPDPIAREWMRVFPNTADQRGLAILSRLSRTPLTPAESNAIPALNDSTFRAQVARLYNMMRASLAAGNLKAFSTAYDSLGVLLGQNRK
jgi:uncharacterized membrane protein (UPF0182 family)